MGRKLRVLLIHDRPDLGDDAVAILRSQNYSMFAPYPKLRSRYLSSYYEVIQALRATIGDYESPSSPGSEGAQLPDLLIIDCNFELDEQAPPLVDHAYGPSEEGDVTEGLYIDPRGLLYGALWAAYMAGKASLHPFSFTIYSQAVDQIREDGFGLTFLGALLAMADPTDEATAAESSQGAEVRRLQEACAQYVRPVSIAQVLEDATVLYRKRLRKMADDDMISMDSEMLVECRHAVERFVGGESRPSPKLSVRWYVGGQMDEVRLISLAPDALGDDSSWRKDRCGPLLNWLGDLADQTNWKSERWQTLISRRDDQDVDNRASLFRDIAPTSMERNSFRVLALVMVWSELWCKMASMGAPRAIAAHELLAALSLDTNQAQRPLRYFFGEEITLVPFLGALQSSMIWPFSSLAWVAPAVQSYLRSLCNGNTAPWIPLLEPDAQADRVFRRENWPPLLQ